MAAHIKVRTLTGTGIKTYIPSIAKIRQEVFKEYPYLHFNSTEEDRLYLKRLAQSKDSIAVLVFDGPKIIGVSTGNPLEEQPHHFHKPFLEKAEKTCDYYYFGNCMLLKPYRGRGLAHHFFDLREKHVMKLKRFKKICLTDVLRPKGDNKRPKEYFSLDTFWRKLGYVQHQDLTCEQSWHEIDEKEPTVKSLVYWIKEIN